VVKQAEDTEAGSEADRLIGANVQQFRNAKKMSQAQLAEAMSEKTGQQVAQQTILKIEKGTRPLRYSEAVGLAAALDIPLTALAPDRLVARERARVDVASLDAAASFANAVQMILEYVTSAQKLKVVLDESPNVDKFFTATELEHMRWLAEGEFYHAIQAARPALHTGPEMPQDHKPIF
jgi:transcriptional regulator with XRE-family HTH domain